MEITAQIRLKPIYLTQAEPVCRDVQRREWGHCRADGCELVPEPESPTNPGRAAVHGG